MSSGSNGSKDNKKGGIALLKEGQGYLAARAPGWIPTKEGSWGLVNPAGWGVVHGGLWKMEDGVQRWIYDQVVVVENAGAVVVILDNHGRVAMVQNFRMVGERLDARAGSNYVRSLNTEGRWQQLLETLGQDTWECPKGLARVEGEEELLRNDFEAFIKKVASQEAREEAGITLSDIRVLPARLNWNPTFCVHAQYVVIARMQAVDKPQHEDFEIISGLQFCSPKQVRKMVDSGLVIDGMTLGALAIAGFHF